MTLVMQPVKPQTKAHDLCEQLTGLAYRLGPGSKLPTVVQLCATLEVSPTTLNGALGVLEFQGVIERRRGLGIFVSKGLAARPETLRLVLICSVEYVGGAHHSPFWDRLIAAVRERAEAGQEGLELHLTRVNGGTPPQSALNPGLAADLMAGRVHGVLGVGLPVAVAQWIDDLGVPLVTFAGPARMCVGQDVQLATRLAVTELARRGCERLGWWGYVLPKVPTLRDCGPGSSIGEARRQWGELLTANGLTFEAGLFRHNRQLLQPDEKDAAWGVTALSQGEQGLQTALDVFGGNRETWPDGLFIGDDLMTSGALVALDRLGVRPGIDVQLATTGNRDTPTLLGREASLILIEFDPNEIVEMMFARLEGAIHQQDPSPGLTIVQPYLREFDTGRKTQEE